MVKQKKRVVWGTEAQASFRQAVAYIKKGSPQNADKVKKEVLASTNSLADEPERLHAPDKDRRNNDGSYRAYEIHKYRIAYFAGNDIIRIVRFRHTHQEPQKY